MSIALYLLHIQEMLGTIIAFILLSYLYFFAAICIGFFFFTLAQDIVDLFKKK